jgi:hypothetical protein
MERIAFLIIVLFFTASGFAQQTAVADSPKHITKIKKVQNPAAWACPTCFKITKDGSQCPDDKTDKVQLGTYYCEHCVKATGNKPGKCPTCGAATTQMTRKLCAKHTSAVKKAA